MKKFIPESPDTLLIKEADMSLAKFGHINSIVLALQGALNNEYADNVAAKAAGLVDGDFYHTAGFVKVVYTP